MNFPSKSLRFEERAFSLVEAMLTIAIMGILSGLVVGVVTNASKDASRMMARQQQAAVQSAVDAWVASQMRDTTTGQVKSLESIRSDYNSRSTSLEMLTVAAGCSRVSTSRIASSCAGLA